MPFEGKQPEITLKKSADFTVSNPPIDNSDETQRINSKLEKGGKTRGVTEENDIKLWLEMYKQIFTDPGDLEDDATIMKKMNGGFVKLFFIILEGEEVGIRMVNMDKHNQLGNDAAYVPYGGIIEQLRGKRVYPNAMRHNEEIALKENGINAVTNDCEDPRRIDRLYESYGLEKDDQQGRDALKKQILKRLEFFIQQGYLFVDDPELPYRRPGSENTKDIQAYDLVGFKVLNKNSEWGKFINPDNNTISKEGYRKLYLALSSLDQCVGSEDELRKNFPAVNSFLNDLDASPKNEFNLYQQTPNGTN